MCQPRINHGLGLFTESTLAEEPHIALLQSACRVGMMLEQQASAVRHPAQGDITNPNLEMEKNKKQRGDGFDEARGIHLDSTLPFEESFPF